MLTKHIFTVHANDIWLKVHVRGKNRFAFAHSLLWLTSASSEARAGGSGVLAPLSPSTTFGVQEAKQNPPDKLYHLAASTNIRPRGRGGT